MGDSRDRSTEVHCKFRENSISLYKGVPAICDTVYVVDCSERIENSWNIVIDK